MSMNLQCLLAADQLVYQQNALNEGWNVADSRSIPAAICKQECTCDFLFIV